MSATASLPEHVIFRELPFCGVLVDTRSSNVFRLSQEAAAALREALHSAGGGGPYEPGIRVAAPAAGGAQARKLLAALSARGLVRTSAGGDED